MKPRDHRLAYLALEAPREGQASYTHVHEIVEGLRRRGWSVDVHKPAYSNRWERPSLKRRLFSYAAVQLRLILSLRRYDAVYVRAHFLAYPTSVAASVLGMPVLQEVNGPYEDLFIVYPPTRRFRAFFEAMQRHQYRWASALITVTPQLASWIEGEVPSAHCRVISNGANVNLFHPGIPRCPGLPERYVVFCGGLAPWHGIDGMLAAAAHPRWPSDVALVIVGDGAEREKVIRGAASNTRTVALGRLRYTEVPSVVAGALAGLVTTSDPGGRSTTGLAPLKLFETLACGIPAVVTNLPGQADLVRQYSCGVVVPLDDPAALADAVAALAADPALRRNMGERGAELVRNSESWDMRAAMTDRLLRDIITTTSGRRRAVKSGKRAKSAE